MIGPDRIALLPVDPCATGRPGTLQVMLSLARAVGAFLVVFAVTWLAFQALIDLPEESGLRFAVQALPWLVAGVSAVFFGARGVGQRRRVPPPVIPDDDGATPSTPRTDSPSTP
jgi:hypothetical protein